MRRYNIVPLILLILLSIINFALAAPVLIPEEKKVSVDVVHVPKDVITVLGKRGDDIEKLAKLFDNFDRWWGDYPEYEAAPLESGHGPMQEHVPPANPASSTQPDRDPESLASHPPTPSTASSSESDSEREPMPSSASDRDSGAMNVDQHHDAPPPNPESLIESGHSHTLPSGPEWSTESEHGDAPPSSPGSDSNSALTHGNLGESSNAPATSATGGILRRDAGVSLPSGRSSNYPKRREQSASRGSANPVSDCSERNAEICLTNLKLVFAT